VDQFQKLLTRLLKKSKREISDEELARIVQEVAKEVGEGLAAGLREGRVAMLIDHASIRAGFETRLRDPWGEALDGLYTLQVVSAESGEEHFKQMGPAAAEEHDMVWAALVGLHARACHITSEIHALLRTGHAEGALARWRTLHEVMVVAVYLATHDDDDLATRYLEHEAITTWHDAEAYQRHAGRLGLEPYTDAELEAMRTARDELLAKYGTDYDRDYGWLAGSFLKTFASLEERTDLAHWRPYYREANQALHAGSLRLSRRLGVPDEEGIQLLVGPSNAGLEEAGINTAPSLAIASSTLLGHRPNLDSLVSLRALLEFADETQRAFGAAAEELERRIAEEEKADAKRARRRERDRARRHAAQQGLTAPRPLGRV
jgi:hypothetical protein